MRVALADVPVEARAEAAWWAVMEGVDPYDALHAALWPESCVEVESMELASGFCIHGHPRTQENTYYHPVTGWMRCRACAREKKRTQNSKPSRKVRRKVPCVYCGAPATAASDKGTGGHPTPRCRPCFMSQLRQSKGWR